MRTQSSAMAARRLRRVPGQAAEGVPVGLVERASRIQLRSLPMLATPAMPVSAWPSQRAVDHPAPRSSPCPARRCRPAALPRTAAPRYTRCVAKPRYSLVIWNSIISGVFGMAPNSGLNGSRGWKSIGAVLHLHQHVVAELAVQRLELVVGLLGAVVRVLVANRRTRATSRCRRAAPARRPACWRRRRGCGRSPAGRAGPRSWPSPGSRRSRGCSW